MNTFDLLEKQFDTLTMLTKSSFSMLNKKNFIERIQKNSNDQETLSLIVEAIYQEGLVEGMKESLELIKN
jgi:hypothetical protein